MAFKAPFLRQEGNVIKFKGEGEFVFIVPEMYFARKCAVVEGEYINLLGTIDYSILRGNETDITKRINNFFFPSMFYTKPGRMEKVKNLNINGEHEDYRLLYYKDNDTDEIISNTKVPQDIEYVERLNALFIKSGHINKSIPYDKLQDYFFESIRLNGASYKVSAQLFGVVISELCRDPHNMSNPFRWSKTIDENMYGYKSISIKDVPKYISPYQSLISENWDDAVIGAIMNDNEIESPMEKIMTN